MRVLGQEAQLGGMVQALPDLGDHVDKDCGQEYTTTDAQDDTNEPINSLGALK